MSLTSRSRKRSVCPATLQRRGLGTGIAGWNPGRRAGCFHGEAVLTRREVQRSQGSVSDQFKRRHGCPSEPCPAPRTPRPLRDRPPPAGRPAEDCGHAMFPCRRSPVTGPQPLTSSTHRAQPIQSWRDMGRPLMTWIQTRRARHARRESDGEQTDRRATPRRTSHRTAAG